MRYRKLGASGIEASVVAFGAWAIGGWMWGGADEKEAIRAIHTALDSGINFIDTAPMYGLGTSERIVGKAIRDSRERVVLATKCGMIWHEEKGEYFYTTDEKGRNEDGQWKVYKCNKPESIRYEVEQSLSRLQTDYIDLYQTHWQDSTTPVEETMETLLDLKKEGKIRAIGCCNADLAHLEQYQAVGQLDVNQELYSMLDRQQDAQNLPFVQQHGLAFLAYSPLGQGLLTGKLGPERTFGEGDLRNTRPRFSVENRERVHDLLALFQKIADRHEVNLAQLAIAWTVAQPGCTHALVGARSPEQVVENAKGGEITLPPEDVREISEALATVGKDIV
jgi:aryl-alcohol dehydrogenase-like predicted oxidoreductase